MFGINIQHDIDKISSELSGMLDDPDSLAASIERDPNFCISDAKSKDQSANVEELLKKDSKLTQDLTMLRELQVVSSLIDEFKANYELWELENCYYSLQNIHKRLAPIDLRNQSIRFRESLSAYIDSLHVEMITRILEAFKNFWIIDPHIIKFTHKAELGEDKVELDYDSFKAFVEHCFYPEGHYEPNMWFTSMVHMEDARDEISNVLSQLFNDYIKLSSVTMKLKDFLFASNILLKFEHNTLSFEQAHCTTLQSIVNFQNLTHFLSDIVPVSGASLILSNIGNILVTEIVKFVKQKSTEILTPGSSLKQELIKLDEDLVDLSRKVKSWNYNKDKLGSLLYDEHILNNLLLDKLLRDQILNLRAIFQEESWKELHFVELKEPVSQTPITQKNKNERNSVSGSLDDEWKWNEDEDDDANASGWGEEIDIALENNETNKDSLTSMKGDEEDDAWESAWNDETLDLDKDANSIAITRVPDLFERVLNEFELGCDEIGRSKIATSYQYKLNVLLTSFMAMCMTKYEKWWQLHKDIHYVVKSYSSTCNLFQLAELIERYVHTHIENMKKVVQSMVSRQLKNLQTNENNPNWEVTIENLIPFIKDVVYPSLVELQDDKRLGNFLSFIYIDCIVDQILNWNMISEKNSENLAELINLVLMGTEGFKTNPGITHLRDKLDIIGKVLTSHLTDIMDMFSNGDFYLFTTDEIVQWIAMLFADTGLRRECIDEIRTVRQESEL